MELVLAPPYAPAAVAALILRRCPLPAYPRPPPSPQGQYVWKLLAVDLGPELQHALPAGGATSLSAAPPRSAAPSAAPPPPQHRVYVVGDLEAYQRGGVLGQLRGPFLQVRGGVEGGAGRGARGRGNYMLARQVNSGGRGCGRSARGREG